MGGSNGEGKRKRTETWTENTINDNWKLRETTEKGTTSRSEVARILSLNTPPTNAELQEESNLENFDDGKGVDNNGTVKLDAEKEAIHIANTEGITRDQPIGKEQIKEHKEPWTNMFKNN
ncbi:hypothetical protein H5410_006160 [Solanum commersonii]|uniref:Uncharacterized protein n=1 Tax=Solanum commersonii TaxID=4109 RepID=A0A9J6A8F1_SOLCO|nr:hypothetical protein H5410_006160 [Solanum commersonii]